MDPAVLATIDDIMYNKNILFGAVAQLGERRICIPEVRSSILLGSIFHPKKNPPRSLSELWRILTRRLSTLPQSEAMKYH